MPRMRFHISLTIFSLLLVILVTALFLANLHRQSQEAIQANAEELFRRISREVAGEMEDMLSSALTAARSEALSPTVAQPFPDPALDLPPDMPRLLDRMNRDDIYYSLYLAHDNGDFFQLIAGLRGDPALLKDLQAPASTATILRVIRTGEDGVRRQFWQFRNGENAVLSQRSEDNPDYDPRKRPWYQDAIKSPEAVLSAPYVFSATSQIGMTAAQIFPNRNGVVGVDFTLDGLNRFLAGQQVSPRGGILVLDGQNQVLAAVQSNRPNLVIPPLTPLEKVDDPAIAGMRPLLDSGMGGFAASVRQGIPMLHHVTESLPAGSLPLKLLVFAPREDYSQHLDALLHRIVAGAVLLLLVLLPITLWGAHRMSRSLSQLALEADRIRRFDFSGESTPCHTLITEVAELRHAFVVMRQTISQRTRAMEESQAKLKQLVQGGIALASETDPHQLLRSILWNGKDISQADAATLYLCTPDKQLRFAQRTKDDALPSFTIPLYDPATGEPNHRYVATHVALSGRSVRVDDVYSEERFDLSGTRKFDAESGYHTVSMLTVPLKPRDGDTIGVLQFINAMDPGTGQAVPFDPRLVEFVEAMASQAAVALDNLNLLEAQKKLFDSVIQIIAGAIDAKSPYT
ncbi:MAG: GAF domain-containing protein, partial [Magnetococcus sp. WYHC-3]